MPTRAQLARLERLARQVRCPGCGRPAVPEPGPGPAVEVPAELAALLATVEYPPCGRCGRPDWSDVSLIPAETRKRLLELIRQVFPHRPAPPFPA